MSFVALLFGLVLARDTAPIQCENCADWNQPRAPFRIGGNTYYVGTDGLAVILVKTADGLVLFDGALPQSVPIIAKNIRTLGFRIEDVKWIFVSHAHFDHVGGVAALVRLSGARVGASPKAAAVLRAGRIDAEDPQFRTYGKTRFSPVRGVIELADGATTSVGEVTIAAHHTPGHSPGGTSWSWQSCEERRCKDVVYVDSLTAVSSPGFYFGDNAALVAQFRASFAKVRDLPCDIVVCPHPSFCGTFDSPPKGEGAETPPREPSRCAGYADRAASRLEERLKDERKETKRSGVESANP